MGLTQRNYTLAVNIAESPELGMDYSETFMEDGGAISLCAYQRKVCLSVPGKLL